MRDASRSGLHARMAFLSHFGPAPHCFVPVITDPGEQVSLDPDRYLGCLSGTGCIGCANPDCYYAAFIRNHWKYPRCD